MTVLVTGATGRVGSRFVPRLIRRGDPVRLLVRDPSRAERLGADIVVGDLRDADSLTRALDRVDAVVHLGAAFRGVRDEEAVAVNHVATVELARAALRAGVDRFVFASTNLVYGPGRGRPAREDDEPAPHDVAYPRSKAEAEQVLLDLHRAEGLPLRIVRLAFVYGEGDDHLAEFLPWARTWPLDKRIHLVHHADVGLGLIRALTADGIDGAIYNVADDAPVTAFEVFELTGEPIPDDAATRVNDDPWESIVDTARIRRDLGFRPVYPTLNAAKDAGAL